MDDNGKKLAEAFREIELFVFDCSAIVNMKDLDIVGEIADAILQNFCKVLVTQEFYSDYEVIVKSLNEFQKAAAQAVSVFLKRLSENNCLLNLSEYLNARDMVLKLHRNPKVCFVYYINSECAEAIVEFGETLAAKAVTIDEEGNYAFGEKREDILANSVREIDRAAIDDDFFAVSSIPGQGMEVKTREGEVYSLGKLIGSGGEGSVYEIDREGYVIKIYNRGQLNQLRLKKLAVMERRQVEYAGICWPEKMVFSSMGEPVGYLMKRAGGKALSSIFECDDAVLKAFPNWKKKDLVLLAIDILQKIQYLHLLGILVGDLRMHNIVIDGNGMASLVDIDSCQIGNLPCPTGFPDFTPPELLHQEFKKKLRTFQNESFSCAVLMFKILFCGLHPYDQRHGADTIEEEIASRSFPYPEEAGGDYSRIPWGGYESMWRCTPHQFQSFLYNIFKKGVTYSVQEMIAMLKVYDQFLTLKEGDFPYSNQITFQYES